MGNLREYSGITTKIRAMKAKLFTDADFEHLANLKSVPEAIEYLKEKPAYIKYINRIDTSLWHRGNVERILMQSLYDDYTRIFRFAGMQQKKYLKTYWKRYEVNLINYCLRIVFNQYDVPFDIELKKEVFEKYSKLSAERLMASRNIDDLVESLKGSEYYETMSRIRESGHAELYDYDLALDLYYFSTMWKKEKRLLKGQERDSFMKDFGTKIDLLNLQWIYRAKKYYHMLAPDIYSLTIPIQYRLSVEEFKALVEAPTVEEFLKQLEQTRYGEKFRIENERIPEQQYKAILKRLYLADWRQNPYSISAINTYLFLKEEEILKLTTALECIRYGLTPRETLAYLGGVNK